MPDLKEHPLQGKLMKPPSSVLLEVSVGPHPSPTQASQMQVQEQSSFPGTEQLKKRKQKPVSMRTAGSKAKGSFQGHV